MLDNMIMIAEPTLERRKKGLRKWAMAWALFNKTTLETIDRRQLFWTKAGAERWLKKNTITEEKKWSPYYE